MDGSAVSGRGEDKKVALGWQGESCGFNVNWQPEIARKSPGLKFGLSAEIDDRRAAAAGVRPQ